MNTATGSKPSTPKQVLEAWAQSLTDERLRYEWEGFPRLTAKLVRERPSLVELANVLTCEMARRAGYDA